jgi:hypothetical protein
MPSRHDETVAGGDLLLEERLRTLGWCEGGHETQAPAQAMNVRVDREHVALEIEEQHARGRLAPDTFDTLEPGHRRFVVEVVQKAWSERAVLDLKGGEGALDGWCLLVGKTAAADGVGNLVHVGG